MRHVIGFGSLLLALVFVALNEKDSVRVYSKEGKLKKAWTLADFLTPAEIHACAQTGATIQWLDDGVIQNGRFYMKGPSQVIRALQPPFTVMRGVDTSVSFRAFINLDTLELTKRMTGEP